MAEQPRTAGASVGVVIPTTGRTTLERALNSVRQQTRKAQETIIVLDDPTRQEDVRLMLADAERLLLTCGGEGGAVARNQGLRTLGTDYVAYLDDDDWWESSKLERQVEFMRTTPCVASFCRTKFHRSNGVLEELPRRPPAAGQNIASYMVQRPGLRYGAGFVQSSALIIDRRLTSGVEWNPQLPKHQDWDYVLRLEADNDLLKVRYLAEPLVHVVQGSPGSVSKLHNWRASMTWYERYATVLEKSARGDFVLSHIMRGALGARDISGVWAAVKALRGTRPHLAAALVAASGLRPHGKSDG